MKVNADKDAQDDKEGIILKSSTNVFLKSQILRVIPFYLKCAIFNGLTHSHEGRRDHITPKMASFLFVTPY